MSVNYDNYREKLKELKKQQYIWHEHEDKVKHAGDKLSKASASNKPVDRLQVEFNDAHDTLLRYIAEYESLKRVLIKDAMVLQYGGW
jgi:molecular chaperone GrpE (heat shock protein)